MKEMNRREFLTLTGAAVVALSLAGCGGPSAPAAPTGKEAKVLDALTLYRKEAGVNVPLTMDDGLKPAAEIVVKLAKGDMEFDEDAANALTAAYANYNGFFAPIGVRMENDSTHVTPVCVYSDDAEQMAQDLQVQAAGTKLNSPAITLVNIQTFELSGVTYWVALIAESKK